MAKRALVMSMVVILLLTCLASSVLAGDPVTTPPGTGTGTTTTEVTTGG